MNTTPKTLTANALINLLAEDLRRAARFAALVIDASIKAAAKVDEGGGIANVSIGDYEPIDVTVDPVDTESLRDAYGLLRGNRVAFRAVKSADGVLTVVGKADGIVRIRLFTRDGKPHLVVETGAVLPMNA